MDNLPAVNICHMPEAWANTKTWQESCSKSQIHPQNSHNELLLPSAIIVLPILMVISILFTKKLKQHYRCQYQRNLAFTRLQQVAMLERMLSIKVK